VVINDLNQVGMPVKPHKTHTPLIVDANAVLTSTITAQSLQPVTRRHTQEIKRGSSVQLLQLAQCNGSDVCKPGPASPLKESFRVCAPETENHAG
jgi:hypothetical protein